MRMIDGSLSLSNAARANPREWVETEKQNVARMTAALGAYPWEVNSLRTLAGAAGCCMLAVHAGGERPAPALLPGIGALTVAADARLDNRTELCAALDLRAAEQARLDDAELILCAYQRWGTDCAPRLLGDFAFALWDESAGRLFCARDFAGVRPFYYHHAPTAGRFVFASDLQAMAAHPAVPAQLNLAYVAASVQSTLGQFQDTEHTFFQAINKLPPAHCLTVDANGLRRWAYWQAGQTPERRYANEHDYVEELLALLQAAVACRLTSPHPIGAHLSGGLDSSSLAVLAHRHLQAQGRALTGFSWAPPLPEDPAELLPKDERKLVEAVRQAEDLPVCYSRLTPAHVLSHARRDVTLQPTANLQFELIASENAARLGIRTMLSGWGGDELLAFNGRGYFSDLFRRGRWLTLQREFTQRGQLHGDVLWRQWVFKGIVPLLPTAIRRRLQPDDFPPPPPLPTYLHPDFSTALAGVKPLPRAKAYERPGVRRMQIALLQHGHLCYRMESWASHGATLGLAYLFPLLDRRLVEFALSIPDFCFFKNGWKRYLYRTAMAGILPESVRWHKDKQDPAERQAAKRVLKEVAEQLRAELLARADNPFVDVNQLAAWLDAQESLGAAVNADDGPRAQSRGVPQRTNIARGHWLAFVGAKEFPK
ncbi:MAG: hypothetical protein HYR71_07955 [Chloroflexi bacterium]|nr:hypothetical protein [Chloroflexota bacterium]